MVGNLSSFQTADSLMPFGARLMANFSLASGAGSTGTGLISCLPCAADCGDSTLFSQDLDEQGSTLFMPACACQSSSTGFSNGMGMVPGFGGFCPSMMGGQQQMQMLQLMMMLLGTLLEIMMQNGMGSQQEDMKMLTGNRCPEKGSAGLQGLSSPGSFSSGANEAEDVSEIDRVGTRTGKLVKFQGEMVDSSIAPNLKAMVEAAKKDGVNLNVTSGYRSHAEQVALYKKYGPGRAAKPGTSNHESGLAVDFANTPGAYGWLDRNTSRFGLKTNENAGGWERWHVSPTGR